LISPIRGFGLLSLALLLSGCALGSACGPAPYLDARSLAPLRIPDGLDAPDTRSALLVPEGSGGRLASDPDNCIIEPPSFFVDAAAPNPEGLPVRPSSAVAVAGSTPQPAASPLTREVASFLNAWADAWSRRDADAWLGFYADEYVPAGYEDAASWREEQRRRFEVPASTRVDANSVRVEPMPDGSVRARFVQHFGEAPDERSVAKELVLVPARTAARWMITQERIVEVL